MVEVAVGVLVHMGTVVALQFLVLVEEEPLVVAQVLLLALKVANMGNT